MRIPWHLRIYIEKRRRNVSGRCLASFEHLVGTKPDLDFDQRLERNSNEAIFSSCMAACIWEGFLRLLSGVLSLLSGAAVRKKTSGGASGKLLWGQLTSVGLNHLDRRD